VFERKD